MEWKKTSPMGDYKETKDRVESRTNGHLHIIREARSLNVCGRHAGSKPTKRLLLGIAKAHEAMPKKIKDEVIEES